MKKTSKKTGTKKAEVRVTDATGTAATTSRRGAAKENDALADSNARRALRAGGTTEVVVEGRPANTGRAPKKAEVVEITEHKKHLLKGTSVEQVKAVRVGYYGHKRRRIGEVFDMRIGDGELPSWVIPLNEAEPGQDEGTRGLHSGGREDDRIREERGVSKSKKTKIADPTIVQDSLPLGEGGNERKPDGGDEHVI